MLDVKRLRYLDAVYRHKSYTRASEELRVSQPAISVAIQTLEEEYGVKLIVRNSKEVRFTFEGEQFMRYARHILRDCDQAEALLADLSGRKDSTLHLGVSPALTMRLLPHLYRNFFPTRKGATIHIDEATMSHHLEKIQNDILDLSYNALPAHPNLAAFRVIPVTTSEIYAVMNQDHPLASLDRIPLESLESVPICMPDEKSLVWELMEEKFREKGVVPNVLSRHEQLLCLFHMIRFGNFVGFINIDNSAPLFPTGGGSFALRAFTEPVQFEAGFIMKASRKLPKIAQDLIDFVIRTQNEWNPPANEIK